MEEGLLNPFTLRFKSKELEAEYNDSAFPRVRRQVRVGLPLGMSLYLAFGFLDPWIVPGVVSAMWTVRALVGIILTLLFLLTFTEFFRRFTHAIASIAVMVGGVGILVMTAMAFPYEEGRLYYAGLMPTMIWTLLFVQLRFMYALPISFGLVLGYEVVALIFNSVEVPVIINNNFFLISSLIMAGFGGYVIERQMRLNFFQSKLIERERQRAEGLLLNILPEEIAQTLKDHSGTIASYFEEVSVMFADIVNFTPMSADMTPVQTVNLLNEIFSYFDMLVEKYELEKIKTVGDAYMVAAGVPRERPDHARSIGLMALDIRNYVCGHPSIGGKNLTFRIGIHSGPVVAGVIGQKKFQYDMWGDVVNIASRMESHGEAGKIQITRTTYEMLKDEFECEARGLISVKGKGEMETWYLIDPKTPVVTDLPHAQAVSAD